MATDGMGPDQAGSAVTASPAAQRPMRASRFGGFHIGLLLAWFLASFGLVFFAEDLQFTVAGWPLGYWLAAQGSVLAFIAIVVTFAWVANRRVPEEAASSAQLAAYRRRLHGRFAMYLVVLMLFMAALVVAEDLGLRKTWMGAIFVFATIALYAGIGIYSRTSDADEYFVAGRRIPAVYNGMATAADWMSAASFISLAGGLYLQGFSGNGLQPGGLVYIIGWTGGFCLVALMVAPYLRRLGLYTVPDFFGVRYGGRWPRRIAALAAVVCSFMYVVAQIYGVGLITSRLTGVQFEIGILLGLGGVLLCSFLGGMRAVTWTQVAQYVILILAFLIPVSWLAFKQLGNPMAPFVYGQQLEKITALESRLAASPAEQQVTDVYARRARHYEAKLRDVEGALERDRQALLDTLRQLQERRAEDAAITEVRRELAALPRDAVAARDVWTRAWIDSRDRARPLAGMPPHVHPFPPVADASGTLLQTPEASRLNFLALMFCLMVGTAGMPHLLTRFLTTSSVSETRRSVAWSLFFIALLYISVPALAALVKFAIMSEWVGRDFDALPVWIAQWAKVDPTLISASDVNGDRILQFSELRLGADIVMLATPELGGLPYVISGLVAAGGLAAALSTADGLLLTIGSAVAYDGFSTHQGREQDAFKRVMLSKFVLLIVALLAAFVAAQRPGEILYLVSAAFSLAAAAFVPAMVFGIFWSRTTGAAAVAGMLAGLAITMGYMVINASAVRGFFGWGGSGLWMGIQPVSAGVFGVAAGVLVIVLASWVDRGGRSRAHPANRS